MFKELVYNSFIKTNKYINFSLKNLYNQSEYIKKSTIYYVQKYILLRYFYNSHYLKFILRANNNFIHVKYNKQQKTRFFSRIFYFEYFLFENKGLKREKTKKKNIKNVYRIKIKCIQNIFK